MGPSALGRVLIADDQVNILDALKMLLGGEGTCFRIRSVRCAS